MSSAWRREKMSDLPCMRNPIFHEKTALLFIGSAVFEFVDLISSFFGVTLAFGFSGAKRRIVDDP